ncbi:CocE/NonD family hydrolase [Acidisphaera sp. L21]|uniref:CocE/NonD family hydrolase n=1 Tax=Acidisphaera sp. L21 TaxID=1641851 RepID=UPI00131E3E85|nr:CocE/NonD family hydrolase [Acidisphaera sp. L21]
MTPTLHLVTMRDGVRLATDVYLPEGPGPFPAVMERTPYGRNETSRSELSAADTTPLRRSAVAQLLVQQGYAAIYQDCRGRYGSEGRFVKYLSDGEDGFDTCAWLVEQPWCDGRICTMGLSYAAHTQAALGCLAPPGLVGQVMDSGGFCNSWTGGIRQFGAFELKQATWAFNNALISPEAKADPVLHAALAAEDLRDWFTRMPWKPGHSPLRHHPDYEAYLFEQWQHGPFDAFWQQLGIWAAGWHDRYSQAACVHMSSWFDPYPLTATGNYRGLRDAGRGPQRLILGPWTHGARSVTVFGDVDFGPDATIDAWAGDWLSYRLRFFDQVLRGAASEEPAVRLFLMGGGSGRRTAAGKLDHGGHWITAADWPVPEAQPTPFYLHADGSLAPGLPQADALPLQFDYDPRHPVPTIGGNLTSLEPVAVGGSFDQVEGPAFFGCTPPYLPLASRADVLVFQTAALTEPTCVVGPIEAELFVATNGPDTDFTAKLIDVYPASADYPQGYAMILTDGILRLRYAEDPANPRLREPGELVRARVTLFPTANLFAAGHRIRLDISSSNFPKFDVNPNTGEPDGNSRRTRIATNTVFADAERASRVMLPILPKASVSDRAG